MESVVERRPIVVVGVGMVVAGLVGGGAVAAGIPVPYAIVVALAVGSPAMNLGGSAKGFDREAYLGERGAKGVVIDLSVATVVAGLVGGVAVTGVLFLGVRWRPALLAVSAGATALGASTTFTYRTIDYRSLDGEE